MVKHKNIEVKNILGRVKKKLNYLNSSNHTI